MSDAAPSLDVHKAKALELAVQAGGEPNKVVERANVYHAFLSGKTAAAPKAAAAATATTAAATTKPAGDKPAKATPAAGTKPAAAKPGAAAPKAAETPKGDTKDPKGNNTFDDVKAALQKVMGSLPNDPKHEKGKALAYEILAAKGGGVKGVRELKPALYDTVVAACEEALKPKATAAAAAEPSADFEDETDPPEETGGGLSAEGSGEDA